MQEVILTVGGGINSLPRQAPKNMLVKASVTLRLTFSRLVLRRLVFVQLSLVTVVLACLDFRRERNESLGCTQPS